MKSYLCNAIVLVWCVIMFPGKVSADGPDTYHPVLPEAAFEKQTPMQSLPAPRIHRAMSTINLRLTGIDSGIDYGTPLIYIGNPFTVNGQAIEPIEIEPGVLQFRFEQYATRKASLSINERSISIALHPGEVIDLWLDITAMNMKMTGTDALPSLKYMYITGELADINLTHAYGERSLDRYPPSFPQLVYEFDFDELTAESYFRQMLDKVKADTDAIDADSRLSGAAKESMVMDLKTSALKAITEMEMLLSIRGYNGKKKPAIRFADNIHLLHLLRELKLNDPKLIYGKYFSTIAVIGDAAARAGIVDMVADSPSGWVQDAATVFPLLLKAETMQPLTPAEEETLASADDYYRGLYAYLKKKTDDRYAEVMGAGSFVVREMPEYEGIENVLDAIIAQYEGSVVFVDFWATWCGPCINAMRTIGPLKQEMKENGVVSVYITTEFSPKLKWEMSLADIGGEHYYLPQAEWDALLEKYNFASIPTYMIFDKTGNRVYQATGFPGVEKLRGEFEKVW